MEDHVLAEYKTKCFVLRFNDESIEITEQQFIHLRDLLAQPEIRFVQIGDNKIINANSIKEIVKVPIKPNTEIYAETGSNPYYRDWCSTDKKMPFKEWLHNEMQ